MVGIEDGSQLQFSPDYTSGETVTAIVHSHNKILFREEVTSLSKSAAEILNAPSQIQGTLYWCFNGESLDDRRRRMEQEGSE